MTLSLYIKPRKLAPGLLGNPLQLLRAPVNLGAQAKCLAMKDAHNISDTAPDGSQVGTANYRVRLLGRKLTLVDPVEEKGCRLSMDMSVTKRLQGIQSAVKKY